ncbi:uncharacterized protein [Lepeophtheirus salmonis]|uniref:uncharacterized protein isoform X3 n=1 Tax=Lepeophtheirus salmonis TaxID=72036 RepID=UPI003AF354B4
MKFLGVCFLFGLAVLAAGASSPTQREIQEFESFEKEYSKSYHNRALRSLKLKVFVDNLREIEEHNANPKRTWDMGINEFSDLTDEEFESKYMGYSPMSSSAGLVTRTAAPKQGNIKDLPESVDWREKGVITDVKSQGYCGSCWVFSAVEQIESYVAIENNMTSPPLLSTQQITSCSSNPYSCGGSGGCKGAINEIAYMYTQLYGIETEKEYPYTSGFTQESGECLYNASSVTGKMGHIRGYEVLPPNDMYSVMEHLTNKGPLGVSVYAGRFKSYKSGILNGCSFDENITINHAIQMIGYGTDPIDGPYWLVRNSWGNSWGSFKVNKFCDLKSVLFVGVKKL